jgi:hypothetical protein
MRPDAAQRRVLLVDEPEQRLGELGGIVCLLAAHRLPGRPSLGGPLRVVVDRQLGVGCEVGGEQLGAEEARFDDGGVDPERLDQRRPSPHPRPTTAKFVGRGETPPAVDSRQLAIVGLV